MSKRAMSKRAMHVEPLPVILEADEAQYYALHNIFLLEQEERLKHDTEAYVLHVDLWRAIQKDSSPLDPELVLQGAVLLLRLHELREEFAMLQSI